MHAHSFILFPLLFPSLSAESRLKFYIPCTWHLLNSHSQELEKTCLQYCMLLMFEDLERFLVCWTLLNLFSFSWPTDEKQVLSYIKFVGVCKNIHRVNRKVINQNRGRQSKERFIVYWTWTTNLDWQQPLPVGPKDETNLVSLTNQYCKTWWHIMASHSLRSLWMPKQDLCDATEKLRNSTLHNFLKYMDRIISLKGIKHFRTIAISSCWKLSRSLRVN